MYTAIIIYIIYYRVRQRKLIIFIVLLYFVNGTMKSSSVKTEMYSMIEKVLRYKTKLLAEIEF